MTSSSEDDFRSTFLSGFLITLKDIGKFEGSAVGVVQMLPEDKVLLGPADLMTCSCL